MNNTFQIITHRSSQNPLGKQALDTAVQAEIDSRRQSRRYRRLIYYFFEKEIQTDTRKRLSPEYLNVGSGLLDLDSQALVARSALAQEQNTSDTFPLAPRYDSTRVVNDYILGAGTYGYDNSQADQDLSTVVLSLVERGLLPQGYSNASLWISDLLLVLRRYRYDMHIISSLVTGVYNYRSLVQACGDYLVLFARLPMMFEYAKIDWSSAGFLSLLEESNQDLLKPLLVPQYEVVFTGVELTLPYGEYAVQDSPYMTSFAVLGKLWSQQARWIKILTTLAIIAFSSLFGGWALIILPIVWGLLQGASTAWSYVHSIGQLMTSWARNYGHQHSRYLNVYDAMIDPERSSRDTLEAQQTMTRWYDVLPSAGHELSWDIQLFYQKCIQSMAQSIVDGPSDEFLKDVAQIRAISKRGETNHCMLWTIADGQYQEQILYRFVQLGYTLNSLLAEAPMLRYDEHYEAVSELMENKVQQFHQRVWSRSLLDTAMVSVSSGVLGWLGFYLRNWSSRGQQVFAAGTANVVHSIDPITMLDEKLAPNLLKTMGQTDLDTFVSRLQQGNVSPTLWDTLVDLFGHKAGNTTNTLMMDSWRRAVNDQGQSELFSKAFESGMPLGPDDAAWSDLMKFLDRIYKYDSFVEHQSLIHQDWLSETLTSLHNGSMSLDQFAELSQAQREIVAQSAFTALDQNDIAGLILDEQTSVFSFNFDEHFRSVHAIIDDLTKANSLETGSVLPATGDVPLLTGDTTFSGEVSGSDYSSTRSFGGQCTVPVVLTNKKSPN